MSGKDLGGFEWDLIKISIVIALVLVIAVLISTVLSLAGCSESESPQAISNASTTPSWVAQRPEGPSAEKTVSTLTDPEEFDSAEGNAATDTLTLVTELAGRIGAVESHVDALHARLEAMAVSLDANLEPLVALKSRHELLNSRIATLEAAQQALVAQQQTLMERLAARETRKTRQKAERTALHPPFTLTAIDLWDSQSYAVLAMQGQLNLVKAGEIRAGWRIRELHYPDSMTIVHIRTGEAREMKIHG